MESFYLNEKEELDSLVQGAADSRGAEFLQSWQWGELLKAKKEDIIRIGIRSDGKILALATLIKNSLGGGYSYWYAPRGPIFAVGLSGEKRDQAEEFLYAEIEKLDSRAIFIRIEPPQEPVSRRLKIKNTLSLQPKQTLIIDLASSEEELLKAMHQKTRYNINLAMKKGVKIKEGSAADFSEFWRLMSLTGARDNFRLHGASHYQNLLDAPNGFIKLFLAEYEGKNIAVGLFCFWGDKVTYMHGASDNEFRNVMAPYLLQWSVIQQAQAAGYGYYDFYGIDEKRWPGVTRFKLGFGGRQETYAGTRDVIFKPFLYSLYGMIRKIRRLI